MLERFTVLFGVLCLIKSLDFLARMPLQIPVGPALAFVALWIVAAFGVTANSRRRISLAAVAGLAGFSFVVTSWRMYNHHVVLMITVALILLLFDRAEQPTLLKVQLSIVYGFAAVTKLNAAYISGAVLDSKLASSDAWQHLHLNALPATVLPTLAVASILVEAWLAVALWFKATRVQAAVIGVVFHIAMVALIAYGIVSVIRLVVFSGLMLALYLPFFAATKDQAEASGASMVTSSPR